jgi:nitroreductase
MTEPTHPFLPLRYTRRPAAQSLADARQFYDDMNQRRTTRHFSQDAVPRELIEYAIRTAGTAPSGAHQQPWTFAAVSDGETKRKVSFQISDYLTRGKSV